MDSNENLIKSLEVKIKILEIENQKLKSAIDANNNEINEYKSLIHSLSQHDSTTVGISIPFSHMNLEHKIINLNFGWKANNNGRVNNDSKTFLKICGGSGWNCTALGDKALIKGKINKWKIQLRKKDSDILFGIVPKDINIESCENWRKGYITNSGNFGKHNLGIYQAFNNIKAVEGNIIEIIVNLEKLELSFTLNGKDLGIFCSNIIKDIDYVPFVEIYKEGDEVTLIQ